MNTKNKLPFIILGVVLVAAFVIGYMGDLPSSLLVASKTPGGSAPAGKNNAQAVRVEAPETVPAGSSFAVQVTMKNPRGGAIWTKEGGYMLGSWNPPYNTTWGVDRIELAPGERIASGQEKVFAFTTVATTTPGMYSFQWRMNQNGSWFGYATRARRIKVTAATTSIPIATTTPSITVLSPNGGERWEIGSTQSVSWRWSGKNTKLRIQLQKVSGDKFVKELAPIGIESSLGVYKVGVTPDIPIGSYIVEVCDSYYASGSFVCDVSNSSFSIVAQQLPQTPSSTTTPSGTTTSSGI